MLVYGSASIGLVQALGYMTLYQPKCTFGLFGYLIQYWVLQANSAVSFNFYFLNFPSNYTLKNHKIFTLT